MAIQKQTLNFSDLPDIYQPKRHLGKRELFIGIFGLLFVLVGYFGKPDNPPADYNPIYGAIGWTFIFGFIIIISYVLRKVTMPPDTLTAFAEKNGFNYAASAPYTVEPGSIFRLRHSDNAYHVLAGTFHDLPFRMFQCIFLAQKEVRNPKYQTEVTAMAFTLPRALPNIVIRSRFGGIVGKPDFELIYNKKQRIKLEGNFDQYFAVYAPANYEVSALSIIAPNVMEVLLANAGRCDIEIINNILYFYWDGFSPTKERLTQMFSTASDVLDKIQRKLTEGDIDTRPLAASKTPQPAPLLHTDNFWQDYGSTIVIMTILFGVGFAYSFINVSTGFDQYHFVILGVAGAFYLFIIIAALFSARKRNRLLRNIGIDPSKKF